MSVKPTMVCEHGTAAGLHCMACEELALAGFPEAGKLRPVQKPLNERIQDAAQSTGPADRALRDAVEVFQLLNPGLDGSQGSIPRIRKRPLDCQGVDPETGRGKVTL